MSDEAHGGHPENVPIGDGGLPEGAETAELCGVEVPILNWCRECWGEIAPPEEPLPNECPDCGSANVTKL